MTPPASPSPGAAGSVAPGGGAAARRRRFEALALPHLETLYRVAIGLVRAPHDAEDVVQETCLRAYRTFDNFEPGTNEKAWLFTILYSVASNLRRARRRNPAPRSLDESVEGGGEPPQEIVDWSGYEEIVSNPRLHWDGSRAQQAVRALPDGLAQAVVLVDVVELSYEEAAVVMGCPVGTVRSRLHRARRRLAGELRELAASYGLAKGGGA